MSHCKTCPKTSENHCARIWCWKSGLTIVVHLCIESSDCKQDFNSKREIRLTHIYSWTVNNEYFCKLSVSKNMYHTCTPLSPTSLPVPDSCMSLVLCQGVTSCLPCTGPAAGPTPLLREHSVSAVHVTHDCSLLACVHYVWKYSLMTATSKNSFHIITSSRHIIM